jgi:hypothetical protein
MIRRFSNHLTQPISPLDLSLLKAVDSRAVDTIRSVVAEGANVNTIYNYDSNDITCIGFPVLVKASFMGWDEVVTCLLELGADVNALDQVR